MVQLQNGDYFDTQAELPEVWRPSMMTTIYGFNVVQMFRLFFGASIGSVAMTMFVGSVYLIPTLFLIMWMFIWGIRLILEQGVYRFIPRTKENRWMANSIAHYILFFIPAMSVGGVAYVILVALLTIPYGVIGIVFLGWTSGEASLIHNLLIPSTEAAFANGGHLGHLLFRVFYWDSTTPVWSVFKMIVGFLFSLTYFIGHNEITKEQYLLSENDVHLMYE